MVMSVPWLNYPLTIEALKGWGGGGKAEINLLVPQKSKNCFPGFHVPQRFLCLLVPLKSCTFCRDNPDGPNPFCEKVLLLLENGLYFWLGPI